MDSLTQGVLGAATFAIIKDKDIGKKSVLIGAAAGTLPDLDVLLAPLFSDIEFLTVHRSVSHSIGLAVVLSLLLGELFYRMYKKKQSRRGWQLAFFLSIFTHSLLDWCTTYGTKLMSPFTDHLFSLNNIHVFEPVYTVTLLAGVVIYLVHTKESRHRIKSLHYALGISTCYLLMSIVSKQHAYCHFKSQLEKDNIEYEDILVSPTPLNILLWHGIVKQKDGYLFGTYTIFDKRDPVSFQYVESANEIIPKIEDNRLIKYYLDYTQDYPLVERDDDGNVKIYAIKYGPINYYGAPEFVYPLCFNEKELSEDKISIDYSGTQRGPVKNYRNLFRRVRGIK